MCSMSAEALRWVRTIKPTPAHRSSARSQKAVLVALAVNADSEGRFRLYALDMLSDLVELDRFSISRALKALEASGVIERSGRDVRLVLECGRRQHNVDQECGRRQHNVDQECGRRQHSADSEMLPPATFNVAAGNTECGRRQHLLNKVNLLSNNTESDPVMEVPRAREGVADLAGRLIQAESEFCRRGPRPIGDDSIARGLITIQQHHEDDQISMAVSEVIERARAASEAGRPWMSIRSSFVLDQIKAKPVRRSGANGQPSRRPVDDQMDPKEEARLWKLVEDYRSGVRWVSNQ